MGRSNATKRSWRPRQRRRLKAPVLTDANDAAIAKMVVALADTLGLSVMAEGVETEAQRWLLATLGCHSYQGYLFSRPLPTQEFEEFSANVLPLLKS